MFPTKNQLGLAAILTRKYHRKSTISEKMIENYKNQLAINKIDKYYHDSNHRIEHDYFNTETKIIKI